MTNRTLYLVFHMRYVCSITVCGTEDLPGLIVVRVVSFLALEAIPVSALPEPSTASHRKTSTLLCIVPGAGCQVWSEWECSLFGCNRIYFYFVCTINKSKPYLDPCMGGVACIIISIIDLPRWKW